MSNQDHIRAPRAEIERIVREVLAEMSARAATSRPAESGLELIVTEKVVSAKEIEYKLDGVTRLVVTRGAIITPAARDLLRERKIAIATSLGG